MSERKPAHPAHTQIIHEDEDDEPLAHPDHVVASDDEDDQPLVRPASKKGPSEERRDPAAGDGSLTPLASPSPSPVAQLRR